VGKSAFAGFVTLRNTQATGHGALILSYEMKPEKWRERFISAETGINTWMARKRGATREQRERMAQAAKAIGKLPIHVHNSVGMGVDDIQSVVRRTKIKEPGLSLVVLDYVGLVKPRQGQEPRLCMREASNTMKQLAMELDIVVFLLAQLNRESQKDKVVRAPRLIDLKDCGDLEQDADMVYLLHRDAKIKPEDTPTYPVNVEVAKNRNGLIGATTILFDSHTLRYLDPSEEREPERKAVDDRDLDY
jgi:replicative DNA helicase